MAPRSKFLTAALTSPVPAQRVPSTEKWDVPEVLRQKAVKFKSESSELSIQPVFVLWVVYVGEPIAQMHDIYSTEAAALGDVGSSWIERGQMSAAMLDAELEDLDESDGGCGVTYWIEKRLPRR